MKQDPVAGLTRARQCTGNKFAKGECKSLVAPGTLHHQKFDDILLGKYRNCRNSTIAVIEINPPKITLSD